MQNRIVEVTTDGAHVCASRGFLQVKVQGDVVGQVSIDDIAAVVIRGYGATLSVNICARLSSANAPIVICAPNQSPASVIWPVSGHHAQGHRMQAQADAKVTLKKRLWTQIIKAKITAQVSALELTGKTASDLRSMAARVKSGDPENIEAQAARRYWSNMMGKKFTRNQSGDGANAALNYGYTILRAATARSILAAGLHPSLSIFHQSRGDALRLADDLMEPFRPWVDVAVSEMMDKSKDVTPLEMTPEIKAKLVEVLSLDLDGPQGASPLQLCVDRLANSLAQVFLNERKSLEIPGPPIALALSAGRRHGA